MFKPRHNYKSPITYRYRGAAKGCPVFNNINGITSSMVEQHEECLECLAKIKNRNDLYKTLAENNKPSNNVIKSLQRLSSSASNNRLKTCLQFLIIKVNEKSSVAVSKQANSDGNECLKTSPSISNDTSRSDQIPVTTITKHSTKRQKLYHNQFRQQVSQKQHNSQLASPPQDQVSSTQDQVEASQEDQDCQTSPLLPNTTEIDELDHELPPNENIPSVKDEDDQQAFIKAQSTQSSPRDNYASSAVATMTTSSTSPIPFETNIDACSDTPEANSSDKTTASTSTTTTTTTTTTTANLIVSRRNTQQGLISDNEASSIPSWSSVASYGGTSPPSPLSSASTTSSSDSSSSRCSSPSSPSTLSRANSPTPTSPLSSPDIVNELRGPRLKLSEDKIRKIKRRPVLFIDEFFDAPERQSVSISSTPNASSGCSPGQQSTVSQNSDLTQSSSGFSSLTTSNMVVHMFQAPPAFVNTLKLSCNLPPATKTQEPSQTSTPPTTKVELLNCVICGIRDKPPNISKMYGQNSCLLCTKFFVAFLKNPQQLYCAQDGDCLMTFDSRCQACWVKVCLQKFDIDEEHRKIGQKYSPKLLSIKYK